MALIIRTLDELSKSKPELPVHLNYSDLPENDFNAVGRLLNNFDGNGTNLQDAYPHLTISTTPMSFYRAVMPPSSLSLGFSATAMHWLRNAPKTIDDHIHIASSNDASSKKAFRQRAHEALIDILSLRAAEMHQGAHFLLVNFGINESGQFLGNTRDVHMFDTFYALWKQMAADGEITDEEVLNTNFPQYYRSAEDYHRVVSDPRLLNKFEIIDLEELVTECPYREDFRNSGDRETFVKTYPDTLQTWSYEVFYSGLDGTRSVDERHKIVHNFFDRYKREIAANPTEHGMDYVHHLLLIKRL